MRADIQQRTPACDALRELGEDVREDAILVLRLVLARDPVVAPALVVHAIEKVRQRRERAGLREAAGAALLQAN